MNIITKAEASDRKLKRYYTGKPCPLGHDSERYTSNCGCVMCGPRYSKERYDANPERERERKRAEYRAKKAKQQETVK